MKPRSIHRVLALVARSRPSPSSPPAPPAPSLPLRRPPPPPSPIATPPTAPSAAPSGSSSLPPQGAGNQKPAPTPSSRAAPAQGHGRAEDPGPPLVSPRPAPPGRARRSWGCGCPTRDVFTMVYEPKTSPLQGAPLRRSRGRSLRGHVHRPSLSWNLEGPMRGGRRDRGDLRRVSHLHRVVLGRRAAARSISPRAAPRSSPRSSRRSRDRWGMTRNIVPSPAIARATSLSKGAASKQIPLPRSPPSPASSASTTASALFAQHAAHRVDQPAAVLRPRRGPAA
jgi:hypothetical protein